MKRPLIFAALALVTLVVFGQEDPPDPPTEPDDIVAITTDLDPLVARLDALEKPRPTVRRTVVIPKGQVFVKVQHGLGATPRIEDVGCLPLGAERVWLAGVNSTDLIFRTDVQSGTSFLCSASLRGD